MIRLILFFSARFSFVDQFMIDLTSEYSKRKNVFHVEDERERILLKARADKTLYNNMNYLKLGLPAPRIYKKG